MMHNLHRDAVDKALESENGRPWSVPAVPAGCPHWSPIRDSYRIYWHTQRTAQRASENHHSTYKRRSKMDMESLLKDPSICSSVCWKWKISLCPEKFRSCVKSDKHSEKNSLLLTAQHRLHAFRCQRRCWMSWTSSINEGRRRLIPAVINCRKALWVFNNVLMISFGCLLQELVWYYWNTSLLFMCFNLFQSFCL